MRISSIAILSIGVVLLPGQPSKPIIHSSVAVYDIDKTSTEVVYTADRLIEAPNWSPNGKYLLINTGGDLYRLPVRNGTAAELQKIDLAGYAKCNNDKGVSPDGKLIAFSSSAKANGSQLFTVPASGGEPKLMVPETPSYFHGFSPDGRYMAFVAERDKNFDLYRIKTEGGQQERLTSDAGYDDGPDYSPDGKWIYYNSNRSGKWEIWRMPADGAGPQDKLAEQVTKDDEENWFPHCSPDGKWLLILSFPKGTSTHNDRMKGVKLRLMPLPKDSIQQSPISELATFFGGQGSINVNSWAPDSSKFAYVIYQQ